MILTEEGSELDCAAQHFGLLFVWLTESLFPSQTTLSCCAETQPEADGENFSVSTKASLPLLAAVAVCWDLRLEHHWCGRLPQVLNQCELNQKTAVWQGSSCPNWRQNYLKSKQKEIRPQISEESYTENAQISDVAKPSILPWWNSLLFLLERNL